MPSFFFKDTAPTEISTLSLHDALPICPLPARRDHPAVRPAPPHRDAAEVEQAERSEEHTSELQSRLHLLCPLFFLRIRRPPRSPLFPYTTLFRSARFQHAAIILLFGLLLLTGMPQKWSRPKDRKSTRLNSSHGYISYALFFF